MIETWCGSRVTFEKVTVFKIFILFWLHRYDFEDFEDFENIKGYLIMFSFLLLFLVYNFIKKSKHFEINYVFFLIFYKT